MGRPKITIDEFKHRIKERFPEENFEVLEYDSLGKPAIIQCMQCGEKISVSKATNFLIHTKVYGCVNCHGLWREREEKLKAVRERYDILGTSVKNTHTFYHLKCKNCGHERETALTNIMRHLECGCSTHVFRKRSAKEFINEVNNYSTLGPYSLVSDYIDQTTHVLLRHEACGFIWKVRPNDVIRGDTGCPKCRKSMSKGESLIAHLLDENGIQYSIEKGLSNGQRFDFYIEYSNHKIAIELNGIQHYEEVEFFKTPLKVCQERDQRKQQYCLEHGIEMIVIPYTWSKEEISHKIQEIANRLNDYPVREQGISD